MSVDWSTLLSPSHGYLDLAASGRPLSPPDGHYRTIVEPLTNHLSEAGFNRACAHVEIEWLLHLLDKKVLSGTSSLSNAEREHLRVPPCPFSETKTRRLARFETTTRHGMKAVEYPIAERLDKAAHVLDPSTCLPGFREVVRIFHTSGDVGNLAYALAVKAATERVWLSSACALFDRPHRLSEVGADVPMLAHTHG